MLALMDAAEAIALFQCEFRLQVRKLSDVFVMLRQIESEQAAGAKGLPALMRQSDLVADQEPIRANPEEDANGEASPSATVARRLLDLRVRGCRFTPALSSTDYLR